MYGNQNYNSGYGPPSHDREYNTNYQPNFIDKNKPLPNNSQPPRNSGFMTESTETFRNQFMQNINPSSDSVRYSRINNLQNNDDEFDFGSSSQQLVHKESYELDDIQRPPYPPPPDLNPFNDNNDLSHQKFPYHSPDLNQPQNPFVDTAYIPDKDQPPIPIVDEESRIRHNEKQRLRQLRSKPRFHYTRLPYFGIIVTIIQLSVFIAELARMASLTGSAFQTEPYFNPMLGPSTYVLINMGARYIPCMNAIEDITTDPSINYPCPNSTTTETNVCTLNEMCGLSGIPLVDGVYQPGQWYRVIVPIFLHAGFLHILFNLLLQVSMGFSIERIIGPIKYGLIYMLSGIGGFLLGANFTPNGMASTGASGSLFGIVATNLVMFISCGRKNTNMYGTKKFGLFICIMIAEVVVSFVLGLLPGLDNFSHIGGFAIGLISSILLLTDPFFVYQDGIITYHSKLSLWQEFLNNWNPLYNFEDKIATRFFIWCTVRVLCLVFIILYFALLVRNFFGKSELPQENSCSWCKYISCIPVKGWCDMGTLEVENTGTSNNRNTEETSSTSAPPTPTAPNSIENSGFSDPNNKRQLDFSVFEIANDNLGLPSTDTHHQIDGSMGASFFVIMLILVLSFAKLKYRSK